MAKGSSKVFEATVEVLTEAAKAMAVSMVPLGGVLVRTIENSSKEIDAASERGIEDLRQEIAKQELRLGFDMQQARIAQELAIAHRITNAETVEIEEFYDKSGSAQAGVGLSEGSLNLGLRGDGKSVVKRVYKFTGHSVPNIDAVLPRLEEAKDQKPEDVA
ncbi:hypothetical protein [Rhizobium ruizarguesonis]|uniref:hypothetical protein n=1 Tax=Rhizobium ruizarguesonis TaxID=2081791 RepID=UPI0003FC5417|nr:hypothetical protein [Rhizobium ruizarguesonis]QJS29269.1 hypothetical protein RLTA1_19005 [Rhizobium leguminosarum bv. trifolii TA1]UFW93426.1 hypothetical protein RlegTA1_18965 [Rhizobium ruizarguesonis]